MSLRIRGRAKAKSINASSVNRRATLRITAPTKTIILAVTSRGVTTAIPKTTLKKTKRCQITIRKSTRVLSVARLGISPTHVRLAHREMVAGTTGKMDFRTTITTAAETTEAGNSTLTMGKGRRLSNTNPARSAVLKSTQKIANVRKSSGGKKESKIIRNKQITRLMMHLKFCKKQKTTALEKRWNLDNKLFFCVPHKLNEN